MGKNPTENCASCHDIASELHLKTAAITISKEHGHKFSTNP